MIVRNLPSSQALPDVTQNEEENETREKVEIHHVAHHLMVRARNVAGFIIESGFA